MHQQENQVEEMHLKHFNFIHLIFFIMAEQSGIIRLKGTIGGISFYKSGDGYLAREKDISILQSVLLSRVYKRKGDVELSYYFLRKAESKANLVESFELLSIIYSEILKLSYDMVSINVEEYIETQL